MEARDKKLNFRVPGLGTRGATWARHVAASGIFYFCHLAALHACILTFGTHLFPAAINWLFIFFILIKIKEKIDKWHLLSLLLSPKTDSLSSAISLCVFQLLTHAKPEIKLAFCSKIKEKFGVVG